MVSRRPTPSQCGTGREPERPRPRTLFAALTVLAFTAGCSSTDRSDIWTIRPDGTRLHRLTRVGGARSPKWSPDHSSLLFIRRYPASKMARSELWIVKADGTGMRRLMTATDVLAADWSPDGNQIAMVREGSEPNTLQLWVASADGSAVRQVGDPVTGSAATVSW